MGPFPLAIRQMKYLIVAIEYFTKWIEAEPVAQITAHKVQHFVWKNIVCRFGVPRRLISDNGTQFASQQLRNLCAEIGIEQVFASVEHPQTNGQVSKQSFAEGVKEKVREGQRGVGGGSSKDRLGIPHHAPIFYHGDAFQFGVWVGRDDPGRDT